MSSDNRIVSLDRLKGILILLVVLGHALGAWLHYLPKGALYDDVRYLFKSIYVFHMPAFFLLAGVMLSPCEWRCWLRSKFLRLIVPYLVFGVISVVLFQLLVERFNVAAVDRYYHGMTRNVWWHPWVSLVYGAPFPHTHGFRCNGVLWFLPAMFTVTAVANAVVRCLGKFRPAVTRVVELALAIGCSFAYVALVRSGCVSLPWGLSHLLRFLPCVLLGQIVARVVKDEDILSGGGWRWGVPLGLGLAYLALVPYLPFGLGVHRSYVKELVYFGGGLMGTAAVIAVARAVPLRWLADVGMASIGIMMTHKWFILALGKVGVHNGLVVFAFAAAGSYMLTLVIRRFAPWALGERKKAAE